MGNNRYYKKNEDFWTERSKSYNVLDWVKDRSYIQEIISAAEFNKEDIVLDVGTGTGVIAYAVAPLVKEVIGLDISQEMLDHSNWDHNKYFIKRDIREPIFHDNVFDKLTARMVFHHIIEDTQKAMDECYRVLKRGGRIILAEGVPIIPEVKQEYIAIFKVKEERLTFLEEDLVSLMKKSNFNNIKVRHYIMNNFSVKNWLINSGLSKERQDEIYSLHINGSYEFKKAHEMRTTNNDCLIKTKNLILVGEKE